MVLSPEITCCCCCCCCGGGGGGGCTPCCSCGVGDGEGDRRSPSGEPLESDEEAEREELDRGPPELEDLAVCDN